VNLRQFGRGFKTLRGDDSIAEPCRREGIAQSLYYVWSKEFLEAGKRRLASDTASRFLCDEIAPTTWRTFQIPDVTASMRSTHGRLGGPDRH
jgi:transposase